MTINVHNLEEVIDALTNLSVELDKDITDFDLGHKKAEEIRREEIIAGSAPLFDGRALQTLNTFVSGDYPPEVQRLARQGLLYYAFLSGSAETASNEKERNRILEGTKADIKIDEKIQSVPFDRVYGLLQKTTDPETVAALMDLWRNGNQAVGELEKDYIHSINERARIMGYDDKFLGIIRQVMGIDIEVFKEQIYRFMEATRDRFQRSMSGMAQRHFNKERISIADYLFYSTNYATGGEFNPIKPALEVVKELCTEMGIDEKVFEMMEIDDKDRESKKQRAFVDSTLWPQKIIVSFGIHSRTTLKYEPFRIQLHELGHALHHGNAAPGTNRIYVVEGDKGTAETFSFLWERLLFSPVFLKIFTDAKPEQIPGMVDSQKILLTYMARRYMAKTIFELKLYSGDFKKVDDNLRDAEGCYISAGEMYSDILGKALFVDTFPERWASDIDHFFYGAHYAMAFSTQAQLTARLEREFGNDWFRKKPSGDLLKRLWAPGSKLTTNDLAREIGSPNGVTTQYLSEFLAH